jgi:hypothetical protein
MWLPRRCAVVRRRRTTWIFFRAVLSGGLAAAGRAAHGIHLHTGRLNPGARVSVPTQPPTEIASAPAHYALWSRRDSHRPRATEHTGRVWEHPQARRCSKTLLFMAGGVGEQHKELQERGFRREELHGDAPHPPRPLAFQTLYPP